MQSQKAERQSPEADIYIHKWGGNETQLMAELHGLPVNSQLRYIGYQLYHVPYGIPDSSWEREMYQNVSNVREVAVTDNSRYKHTGGTEGGMAIANLYLYRL